VDYLLVSILYVVDQADFLFLRRQTGLSGGNLSSHATKLEEAGYVSVDKRFVGKRPQTLFSLTPAGRRAFESYREAMASLLDSTSGSEHLKRPAPGGTRRPGAVER
jgi:DNA-binding MarR family transcriptional regulator